MISMFPVMPALPARTCAFVRACLLGCLVLLGAACSEGASPPAEASSRPLAAASGASPASSAASSAVPSVVPPSAPASARFAPAPSPRKVAVVYTASVQGYVTPCGCTAEPLGGVARLAAALAEARAAYGERVLFLDGGDLLFEKPDDNLPADRCQAEARVSLLLSTYARLGLAGTVRGPLDDVRGAAFRDERLNHFGVPTLGVPDAGRPLVEGARQLSGFVWRAGEVALGVTGFTLDDESELERVRAALNVEVVRLRGEGAMAVIALAQSPRPLTKRLLHDFAGVDVVIQGRAPGESPSAPEPLGTQGPWLVASGMQSQSLGVLELDLSVDPRPERRPPQERPSGSAGAPVSRLALDDREAAAERRARLLDVRIAQYRQQLADQPDEARRAFLAARLAQAEAERAQVAAGALAAPPPPPPSLRARALPLERGMPEEPAAAAALAAYEASVPELVAACEEGVVCPAPAPGAATFVGAETCRACHADAYDFWRGQSRRLPGKDASGRVVERVLSHAAAWETLVREGKDKDRSCVGCHSVGFNQPGGYCRTSEVAPFRGVQCESCHGPGSLHVAGGGDVARLQRGVPETTCRGCHQVPHIPTTASFRYDEALSWILGPGHGAPAAPSGEKP